MGELRAIIVPEDVHTELSVLKAKYKLKTISDVIKKLLGGEIC
jgi:predicted CopG family antitoxin